MTTRSQRVLVVDDDTEIRGLVAGTHRLRRGLGSLVLLELELALAPPTRQRLPGEAQLLVFALSPLDMPKR